MLTGHNKIPQRENPREKTAYIYTLISLGSQTLQGRNKPENLIGSAVPSHAWHYEEGWFCGEVYRCRLCITHVVFRQRFKSFKCILDDLNFRKKKKRRVIGLEGRERTNLNCPKYVPTPEIAIAEEVPARTQNFSIGFMGLGQSVF